MAGEKETKSKLFLSNAPHIKDNQSIKIVMWLVVLALLPSCIYSVFIFGINSLILIVASIVSAILAEALFQILMKKPVCVTDGS
ncbi:MAG: RnfABCDGE type electron transport complex subunit D, partial [Spirochaetota bacterium]|nr:RnfABCDGE type electron transport complex subunit D [Spirochaetota bacterium]